MLSIAPTSSSRLRRSLSRCLIAALCGAASAVAQTRPATFWNATNGEFYTATNWSAGMPNGNIDGKIDNAGTAKVTTANTALVNYVFLASVNGSVGNLEVTGSGSTNIISVNVGAHGTGNLRIATGGKLSSYGGSIASDVNGIGFATVDGAGSSWTVTGPEMRIGNVGFGTMTLRNNGSLVVGGGSGKITLATETISTGEFYIGNGTTVGTLSLAEVANGNGKATVIFDHTNTLLDFSAKFTGLKTFNGYLNIRQDGPGTTVFSAPTSNIAGLITVNGGKLIVNGSIEGSLMDVLGPDDTVVTEETVGDMLVNAMGTLGGKGNIKGTTNVYGTLAPGDGIGVLKFGGDLNFLNGTTTTNGVTTITSEPVLSIQLGGKVRGTSFVAIDAAGKLTYGGTLRLTLANGFVPANLDTFDLFNGYNSFAGSFSKIVFASGGYSGTFNPQTGVLTAILVPEPTTLGLVAGVAVFFGWGKRLRPARKAESGRVAS